MRRIQGLEPQLQEKTGAQPDVYKRQVHMSCAKPFRAARRIHRHVSAADDSHALVRLDRRIVGWILVSVCLLYTSFRKNSALPTSGPVFAEEAD